MKWDEQNVNTCPENFQWKAGHSYILVESPGLYEFSLAFFTSTKKGKKTTLQLLVNDEVVATHHQSGSYSTGTVQKETEKENQKTPIRFAVLDYLKITEKSFISVAFCQTSSSKPRAFLQGADGFLSIRKI